jgi:hypothetical protein
VELALVERALTQMAAASTRPEGWAALVAHPRFLENSTVGGMLGSLTALEQERRGLATRRSEESLEYRVLVDRIQLLDESLRSVAEGYARSLRETVAEGAAREDSLRALLDGMPAAAIEVGRRQRDVRLLTEVLVVTEQRLRQEEIRRALAVANVQVVDRPALTARPVWPRKKLGAAVGLLLAFGSAVLSMVVVERADGRVRDGGRIRILTGAPMLAAPVLGRGGVRLTPDEIAALEVVPARSSLALCGLESLEDARAIEAAMGASASAIEVRSWGPVQGRPEALRIVRDGPTSIVLIARCGATSGDRLARAAGRFGEVGGHILGTVLLCRTEAEGRAAWS